MSIFRRPKDSVTLVEDEGYRLSDDARGDLLTAAIYAGISVLYIVSVLRSLK